MRPVMNAATAGGREAETLFIVGRTGSGKSTQLLTLPGKKFSYCFDPNARIAYRNDPNTDYIEFLPDTDELELRLKGFNKGSLSDRSKVARSTEPQLYLQWEADLVARFNSGFFNDYKWVAIDSATFLIEAMMDRQMYLDQRAGEPPDQGDYRVVGDAFRRIMLNFSSRGFNLYITGHINEYTDDKTARTVTQAMLPGRSRVLSPLMCANVWQASFNDEGKNTYLMRTRPDPRGMKDLRCSIDGLDEIIDVTIKDKTHPEQYGVGAILNKARAKAKPKQGE